MEFRKNENLCLSYVTLRRAIGVLGMLLPLLCVAGGAAFMGLGVGRSISYYYHTNMREFFTGILAIVCAILATYRGYDEDRKSVV